MQSSRPPLVIVTGAPASGKSSLAQRLGGDLRLPVIAKDHLKERLADALGAPADVPASQRLGVAAYAMLYHVAGELLAAGQGVVLESNFRRGLSEAELGNVLVGAVGVQVLCTGQSALLVRRYVERAAAGERHAAHLDAERAAALAEELAGGSFDALELDIPLVEAELDGGWLPHYATILDAVAAAVGLS